MQQDPIEKALDEIAEVFRAERMRQGLSQAELAKRAGLRSETVNQFEVGAKRPSLSTILRMAEVLGLNIVATRDRQKPLSRPAPPDKRREGLQLVAMLPFLSHQAVKTLLAAARLMAPEVAPAPSAVRKKKKKRGRRA